MAAEKSIPVSRVVPASPEAIWQALNDSRRYAEWVPQTVLERLVLAQAAAAATPR